MSVSKRALRLMQAALASFGLGTSAATILPPFFNNDFQQDYLGARALRDGVDIFTPMPELAHRYFSELSTHVGTPNPHPPIVVLLIAPLSFFPPELVFPLWFAFNVGLLTLIGRWLGFSVVGSLALSAWPPVWWVLSLGQWEILLLALALLGWRAAEAHRPWRAGIWFGLAAVIKLYPAFFLLPFAARRHFRIVLAAAGVFVVGQLGSTLVVGPTGLLRYYTVILPEVGGLWVRQIINTSPYGALLRLFGGSIDMEPLADAQWIVIPAAVVLSAAAIVLLVRLPPLAAPVLTPIALPAAWSYQVVLALPQVAALLRHRPLRPVSVMAAAAASFVVPVVVHIPGNALAWALHWQRSWFFAALPLCGAVQAVGLLGLLVLCFWCFTSGHDQVFTSGPRAESSVEDSGDPPPPR